MKTMQKRIMSLFLAVMMIVSIIPMGAIPASAAGGVKAKLDSFISSYPSGSRWTGSFDGGSQCYGFGKMVIYNIFGKNSSGGYRGWNYAGVSTSGMNVIGSITNFSSSNVQSLLSKAKCGDILQFDQTKQHTMIVYSVDSTGVTVYDCNWDNNCGISKRHSSFGAWSGRNSSKLTLLRSDNYDLIDVSAPAAPTDVVLSTTDGKLNIKWSSVLGATKYVAYVYSKSNCSEYAFKKETTECSISGIQLNPGRYWICVHAINSAGAGPGSNLVDYLTAPKNLNITRVGTSIKLSWDSVPSANCYDVIMTDTNGNQSWLHTNKAEKTITNCVPGNYKFKVQSLYRPNGSTTGQIVGAHSDIVSYYFGLDAPKNLKVHNNDGNMNISWDEVDGATCYDVIITTPNGNVDYWHSHSNSKTITNYDNGVYKIKVQGLYRENESKTEQIVSPYTDIIIYDYQKNSPATVSSISVNTMPTKTVYTVGETFSSLGLSIKVNMSDGTTKTLTSGFTVSTPDMSTAGTKTVTVTYEGKTATFNVTVNAPVSPTAAQYKISGATATAGSTVEVYVSIENNPGIISLRNKITYDTSVMELVKVEDMKLLSGYTTPSPTVSSPYTLRWADSLATENNKANGNFVKLTFKIKDSAAVGDYGISVSHIESRTANGEKVGFTDCSAVIKVVDYLLGDVDGNGEINDWDAIVLNRYLAGWQTEIIEAAAEIDGDGELTDWDAIALERRLAGWDV